METIILGYDGSQAALSALEWVADRAKSREVAAHIVGVDDVTHARPEVSAHVTEGRDRLRSLAPSTVVEGHVVRGGMPNAFTDAVPGADLLVVGAHRDKPIRSALMGFVPLRVILRSPVPVYVVPDGWSRVQGPVVVGFDDDGSSDAAVAYGCREASSSGQSLRIVHAWQPALTDAEEDRAIHEAALHGAAAQARAIEPKLVVDARFSRGDAASVLAHESTEASLVVIGTHRRGVWMGGLLGSVVWYLTGAITVPLCVVPPVETDR